MHPNGSQKILVAFTWVVSCGYTAAFVLYTGHAHYCHTRQQALLEHPGGEWRLLRVRILDVLALISKFSDLMEISWFTSDSELFIIFTLLLQPASFRLVYFRNPPC